MNAFEQDLICAAQTVIEQSKALKNSRKLKSSFIDRITRSENDLEIMVRKIQDKTYNVAMVGERGVGKSTAICKMADLQLDIPLNENIIREDEILFHRSILHTGSGGTTCCECSIQFGGESYGIIVESFSDSEIRKIVQTWAALLKSQKTPEDKEILPTETIRLLRNMSGLGIIRNGATKADLADDLASNHDDVSSLTNAIMFRLNLPRRTENFIPIVGVNDGAKFQLKTHYQRINSGLNEHVSIPKKIKVVTPSNVFGEHLVTFIDTKGIHLDAESRPDLDRFIDNEQTLTILCSLFNNAPNSDLVNVLKKAKSTGVTTFNAALMVLPRSGQGKTAAGYQEGYADEDGYPIKEEQIDDVFKQLGISIPVIFFNSSTDDRQPVIEFVGEQINQIQIRKYQKTGRIIGELTALLENYAIEQTKESIRSVANQMADWLQNHVRINMPAINVHDKLVSIQRRVHSSTLNAAVVGRGEFYNLSYSNELGAGAKEITYKCLGKIAEGFMEVMEHLSRQPDFSDAKLLIDQVVRCIQDDFEEARREIQMVGGTIREQMTMDCNLWSDCMYQWGAGRGYRDRISNITRQWFENAECISVSANYNVYLQGEIQILWDNIRENLLNMLLDDNVVENNQLEHHQVLLIGDMRSSSKE